MAETLVLISKGRKSASCIQQGEALKPRDIRKSVSMARPKVNGYNVPAWDNLSFLPFFFVSFKMF